VTGLGRFAASLLVLTASSAAIASLASGSSHSALL
jgi:hypothetical protein